MSCSAFVLCYSALRAYAMFTIIILITTVIYAFNGQDDPVMKRPAGVPPPALPQGWTVQSKKRTSGKTEGVVDKYWVGPDGIKFRSLKAAEAHLGQKF